MKDIACLRAALGAQLWGEFCASILDAPSVEEAVRRGLPLDEALALVRGHMAPRLPREEGNASAEAPASATARVVVDGMEVLLTVRATCADPRSLAGLIVALRTAVAIVAAQDGVQSVGVAADGRDAITWIKPPAAPPPVEPPAEKPAPEAPGRATVVHSLRINETRKGREVVRSVDLFLRPGGEYPDVKVGVPELVDELVAALERGGEDVADFIGERRAVKGFAVVLAEGKPKPNGKGRYLNYIQGSVRYEPPR